MNIYRHQFVSRCPVNGKAIIYDFELRKKDDEKVLVEHIVIAAALWESAYHEQIADAFFKQFGGEQVLTAHHHGVDIETHRGFEEPRVPRLRKPALFGTTLYLPGVDAQLIIERAEAAYLESVGRKGLCV
jgi:hypothetical protein